MTVRRVLWAVIGIVLGGAVGGWWYARGAKEPMVIALLHTTDTRGALDPKSFGCDCKEGIVWRGGLSRRATLIQRLRERYHDRVIVLDSGSVAYDPARAKVALSAMKHMGYDAVGVARADLSVGNRFFQAAQQAGVPVLCYPENEQTRGRAQAVLIKQVGDRKIGVLCIGATAELRLRLDRLAEQLKPLRQQCDVVIVLSRLGTAMDRRLAAAKPVSSMIDVIAGDATAAPLNGLLLVHGTTIMPTCYEGQEVGVLEMDLPRRGRPQYRFRREEVAISLPPDPVVEASIDAFMGRQPGSWAPWALTTKAAPAGLLER